MPSLVDEAIAFNNNGLLLEWTVEFLLSSGGNDDLAKGLITQSKGLVMTLGLHPLQELRRSLGPEPNMRYWRDTHEWENHVLAMCQSLSAGWIPAPLIISLEAQKSASIREMLNSSVPLIHDGNHRHEALMRAGYTEYWAITCLGLQL